MNYDELLASFLATVTEAAESTGEFLATEIPEVINQALLYYAAVSLLQFSIGLGVMVYCLCTLGNSKKEYPDYWEKRTSDGEDFRYIVPIVARVLVALVCIPIICGSMEWLKIWLAPKLWLIEYAAQLAKSVS